MIYHSSLKIYRETGFMNMSNAINRDEEEIGLYVK